LKSLQAAIFDLDGLLIDSEPLWEEAEINIFARHGIQITPEMCQKVKGYRVDESIRFLSQNSPTNLFDPLSIEQQIILEAKRLIAEKAKCLPGCVYILHFFQSRGITLALASSSPYDIIHLGLQKLNIHQHFKVIYSATEEHYGKPHPGVFLTSAKKLGVEPTNCVVFEDALNGIIAAKAAKMKAIAVPAQQNSLDLRFLLADLILPSLLHFKEHHIDLLFDELAY
jgi:sugar-phosphatase